MHLQAVAHRILARMCNSEIFNVARAEEQQKYIDTLPKLAL